MLLPDAEDFNKLLLNAPIGICILDAATLVAEVVNEKFLEVAGKPHKAIYGQYYWDAFAEAREYYEAALDGVVQTGDSFRADEVELMLIRHGQPELVIVTFVYSPVKDEDGNVKKITVWVLENTRQVVERQRELAAKDAFKGERDRLYSYFMQSNVGICVLRGADFVYELVNPAYQQILRGREISGRPIFEAIPELVGTPIQEMILKVYHEGESCEMTEVMVPISEFEGGPTRERYFSFTFQPRRDENNQIDGIVNVVFEVTEMILVQQELRNARELADRQKRVYETITSGTPDLMYVWDLNYRFTYANSALLTMWGKTWDTAIGKGLRENGYEEWHAAMHEREIDHVIATKESVRGEVAFPHAVLGRRIYDYILIPVLNENGEVEAVAGTTRDVTERTQLQQALAKSAEELQSINEELVTANEEQAASNEELMATNEELAIVNQQLVAARQKLEEGEVALRLAIDAANFGTWFIHSVTREFITDARLKELFGYYPEEDITIEQALAQVTDEYRGFVTTKLENAIYNNGDYDLTYPVIGFHDNRLRWLRAIGNLKADPSGAFSAFTGVVMDITEAHLAVQNVERAEESLRMAVEAADSGTFSINARTLEFFASPRLKELFGFKGDEDMPYEACMAQIREDYRDTAYRMIEAALTKGERFELEYPVFRFHDGKQRWLRGLGTLQQDSNGIDSFFTGIIIDITEQKEDEQRKNDFIAMVSHELKTPLTSMKGYVQVLLAKLRQKEDNFAINMLEKANIQIAKMTNMINGFLNISRLESGKIHINLQEFDLAQLIQEAKEESQATIVSHTVIFSEVEPTIVNADRDKIAQVVHNLISNAVKYSPSESAIRISARSQDAMVKVSVKDEGMGIKADDLPRIFDRYYRVEDSIITSISGFGIGLYLCAEIVRRHHGEIWAESEPGQGSTFTFALPLINK